MSKKYTLEYVKVFFEEQGCKLLEIEYINNSTRMKYRCNCGNVSKIIFKDFIRGQRCMKCKGSEKLTFDYVYNYFKEHNCELLEKEYKNNNTLMKYKCECGEVNKIRFSAFKNGVRCKKCGIKKVADNNRFTFEYTYSYFGEQGCELLEEEYINCITLMKYRCSCGNISKITFSDFKQGHRCSICGKSKKYTLKYMKQYFKDHGCELLEKKYVNNSTKMKYRCECGNISKIIFSAFKKGVRCQKCWAKRNSGKGHFNYNPNKTDKERITERQYDGYYKWRIGVYVNDDYTCQKCSQRGYKLNAHHVKNYSTNRSLRLEQSNGITFCEKHHQEFHKIYGKKDNNKSQLEEFLK